MFGVSPDRWVLADSKDRLVCFAIENYFLSTPEVQATKPEGSHRLISAVREDGRSMQFWSARATSQPKDTVQMLASIRIALESPESDWHPMSKDDLGKAGAS